MSYTPPAGNAVNANFRTAYTAPAGNAVTVNFNGASGSGGGYFAGRRRQASVVN